MPKAPPDELRVLGRVLVDLRTERGLSQEAFANVVGVHRAAVGFFERGERDIRFTTLVKLAEGLGMSVPELMTRWAAERDRK